MTTNNPVRASDAEREEVASIVAAAGADGRLTLTETEDRLAGIYRTTFRHELAAFTTDLPKPSAPVRPARRVPLRPLRVHAAIVLVLATVLIVRWIGSGVPYFWPAFPLFWLVASLALHARVRGVIGRGSTA